MADAAEKPDGPTRQSSPRYPFIGLKKALERADQLRVAAGMNAVRALDARAVWGYAPKSSGGDQTIAALGYYGLIEDFGSGDTRKIKLSDLANRYFRDERPEVRMSLETQFAGLPKAMQALWDMWKHNPPSDHIARSILKNELHYSDWAANELLGVYTDNLQYFPKDPSGIVPPEGATSDVVKEPPPQKVKVGDYVQWIFGGEPRFSAPRLVEAIHPGGADAKLVGWRDYIPMSELHIAGPTAKPTATTLPPSGKDSPFQVFLSGDRLQINADVDAAGLKKLQALLLKYEEILELLK